MYVWQLGSHESVFLCPKTNKMSPLYWKPSYKISRILALLLATYIRINHDTEVLRRTETLFDQYVIPGQKLYCRALGRLGVQRNSILKWHNISRLELPPLGLHKWGEQYLIVFYQPNLENNNRIINLKAV